MKPQDQALSLLGGISLLAQMRDEFYAKELHGAGDEVARLQSTLRRQLHTLVDEARLNKVDILIAPLLRVPVLEDAR